MSEKYFHNEEHSWRPEHDLAPEHSMLPEYNPVYPDISYFKESSVTCREENIFQGRPPEGEPDPDNKREERKKRSRYSILQKFLGSAVRAGVVVLFTAAVVMIITSSGDDSRGSFASGIASAVDSAKRPAFTVQEGYSVREFSNLWQGDPDAPHKYDLSSPLSYKEATCTTKGEISYICTECGVQSHSEIPAAGHKAAEPVKTDEVDETCTEDGSYTETVYCSVCGKELSKRDVIIAAAGHTPAEAVKENETEGTCTEGGEYEEVVYCSVCGEEISRETVASDASGHQAAAAVKENETEGTCTEGGKYDEVVYCSVCGEEISRKTVASAASGHQAATAVKENETGAACTEAGHYDSVVYCSVCGEEISRQTIASAALGHQAASAVTENEKAATCAAAGSYDSVVYCSVCGAEISRNTVTTAATGHQASAAVKENETAAACTTAGHYDEVVYCSSCGTELSRNTINTAALGHSAGAAEKEWLVGLADATGTITGPDCENGGSYQEVVRCTSCGTEMSRSETQKVDAPGHSFNLNPHQEYVTCSACGTPAITAEFYTGATLTTVYFYLNEDYLNAMGEAGKGYDIVQLWSYSANAYINAGGYEWGTSGDTTIPSEYYASGEKFRIDFYFSDGSSIISNDVTIP